MPNEFKQNLNKYADLVLEIGLNLQRGQRLIIAGPSPYAGVSIQAAPLVRAITANAYMRGARFVDVMWGDDQIFLERFKNAPHDSFEEFPPGRSSGMLDYAENGDCLLFIIANDPDLLAGQDPELVAQVQKTAAEKRRPTAEYQRRNDISWAGIAASVPSWAAKVFPDAPEDEQDANLWQKIFEICRVDREDPISAWREHTKALKQRCSFLNQKQYSALNFEGPGTDLKIGLPQGHMWMGGSTSNKDGNTFTANLPTEEVFTLPHRGQTEGIISATKPLSYAGSLIGDFSLTFKEGKVVKVNAKKGEAILNKVIENDEGASRLGEVALVPHNSPISQTGLLFYNTLIDENASNHIAIGSAYRFCLQDGIGMSEEEFAAAGGNTSLIHVDFMTGSAEIKVDGLTAEGDSEPVMRSGEWVFKV
ncbi:MAG: aminopeptidase [Chloroflexi bacterium]|nr:aminopeptidase [Chloroflexota bacterium]